MSTTTPRLGLPRPVPTDNANLAYWQSLVDAIELAAAKKTEVDNHLTDEAAHGATSSATPNKIVRRDSVGRFKAASPATSDDVATKGTVDTAIANLLNGAPGALDTLRKMADAVGNDPNFASTITNTLALKAPLASPALTGNPTVPTQAPGTNNTRAASTAYADAAVAAHVADYVRQPGYAATNAGANTYAITLVPALTAYADGVCVSIKISASNTGASTLNVNGLGAKSILDSKGNAMTSGKLKLDIVYTLRYNGSAFILQGEGGEYGTAVATDVLTGKTIGTDTGLVNGAMANNGAVAITPSAVDQAIPVGYHNGLGKVLASDTSSFTSRFVNFDKYDSVTSIAIGTFIPILNVTGSGYLYEAYVSRDDEIKITIDGVIYYWGYATSIASSSGVLSIDSFVGAGKTQKITKNSFANISNVSIITAASLPYSTRRSNIVALIGLPKIFNSSLKIEVSSTTSSGNQIIYGIRGGFK